MHRRTIQGRTVQSRTRHRHAGPALAIACLLMGLPLAGCQQDDPAPAPKATVTKDMFTPSPAASSPAAPTTPSASTTTVDGLTITVMPSDDPLYAEAVEVYSKFLAESWKLDVAGGAKTLPPVFKQYAMGDFLGLTQALYASRHDQQIRVDSTTPPQVRLGPSRVQKEATELIAIAACVDYRASHITKNGVTAKGTTSAETVFFSKNGSTIAASASEVIEGPCPVA